MSRWLLAALILCAAVPPAKASDDTTSDEQCLMVASYREAGTEPLRGLAATIQTIKNRARKRGLTICQTIKQRSQFSWYKRGDKISTEVPIKFLQRYKIAVSMPPVVEECTEFFHYSGIRPKWAMGRKGKVVEHQIYYC